MAGRHEIRENEDSRRRRVFVAILAGVLLSGASVLTASRAAFTAQGSNSSNYVDVGDVVLTDDDAGSAMFQVDDMAPGDTSVACIEVTSQGSIADPGEVRLFSGGFTDSGSLADVLEITVEAGTGGGFAGCSGFTGSTIFATNTLTAFATNHGDYASGLTGWNPASTPESRTFRITIDLPSSADNTVQGDSITGLVFTWEIQS